MRRPLPTIALASSRKFTLPLLGMLLIALVSGCAQEPYLPGYAFYPQPALASIRQSSQPDKTPVTVLATVLGIRREDPRQHVPTSVAIRLQFQNDGSQPITFDPATLELTTGSLRNFPAAEAYPPGVLTLAPGQRATLVSYFPFPPGLGPQRMTLSNLRLRWQIKIDDDTIPQAVLFERATNSNSGAGGSQDVTY
jgi:hypothetical protein